MRSRFRRSTAAASRRTLSHSAAQRSRGRAGGQALERRGLGRRTAARRGGRSRPRRSGRAAPAAARAARRSRAARHAAPSAPASSCSASPSPGSPPRHSARRWYSGSQSCAGELRARGRGCRGRAPRCARRCSPSSSRRPARQAARRTSASGSRASASLAQRERKVAATWAGRGLIRISTAAGGRLLERLEQRVGGIAVEPLGAVDHHHAPAAHRGGRVQRGGRGAHRGDRDLGLEAPGLRVALRLDHGQVGMGALGDLPEHRVLRRQRERRPGTASGPASSARAKR